MASTQNPLLHDPLFRDELLYCFARRDEVVMRFTFAALVMGYEGRYGMFHPRNPGTLVRFDHAANEEEIPAYDPLYLGC